MPTPRDIAKALEGVVDPELGIDIVALGLVYALAISGERVQVSIATTSAGCPLSSLLLEGAARSVASVSPGLDVTIDHTDDPPWDPAMMDPAARSLFARWR